MKGMQAACPPHFRRAAARRTASGLTLLEMLVVFVLASLVGTLLIQGTGFFLGQYDTVKRIGREASSEALQQGWFASTVHAMVPYLAEGRRGFVGDFESFQGVTTQALRAPSGIPVAARWSIVADEAGTAVVYAEEPSPCPSDTRGANGTATRPPRSAGTDSHSGNPAQGLGDIACGVGAAPFEDARWTVLESDEPLIFLYAGLDRAWRAHWPVDGVREWIPRQVRLVTSAGQTVWIASFGLHPEPVGNPRDFR